jgi:hypothetical protein
MSRSLAPGFARHGVHPIRQPQGPPPLDHLLAFPTSCHPGSQNFATRRRSHTVDNIIPPGSRPRNGSLPSTYSSETFYSLDSDDGGVRLTWEDSLEDQTPRSRKQSTDTSSHSQHFLGLKVFEDCASEHLRLLDDWMTIAPGKAFDQCAIDHLRLLDDWQHMAPGLAIPTDELDPEELYIATSATNIDEIKSRRIVVNNKTKRQYQITRLSQYPLLPQLQTRRPCQTVPDWHSYNSRISSRILSTIWQKLQFSRDDRRKLGAMIHGPLLKTGAPFFGPHATDCYKTLEVSPTKKGLQILKKAIQHPLYSPHIRQVIFDCELITSTWHYFCLRRLRRPLAQIIRILNKQSGSSILPIRDALVHLLESFLCALDTGLDVWAVWGHTSEHSPNMQAYCKLKDTVVTGDDLDDHEVYDYQLTFDPGLMLICDRDVDLWLSIFEVQLTDQSLEYDFLLGGLPDPKQPTREGIGYTLSGFKRKLTTTYMTSIEITRSSILLDGLLALLDFNKVTLKKLTLRNLDDQPSSIM